MRCSFVLPVLLLPVIYGLQCCNTTSSNGTGFSTTQTPDLDTSDQISFCLWVKPEHDTVYDLVSYVDPKKESVLYVSTRQVIFSKNTAANFTIFDESNSTHICITWHRDKGVTTFVNGKQHGETVTLPKSNETIVVDFTGNWSAGLQSEDSKIGLVGSLCGFTIWSKELSSSFILSLYNNSDQTEKGEETSEEEGYETDGTDNEGAVVPPIPSYSWQNFTHHSYTSVNDSFCGSTGEKGHGIRLGSLDPVASKFVILFLVIIGVVIGFAALFMCSEREIAIKRAQKRLKDEENFSVDNASAHSVT